MSRRRVRQEPAHGGDPSGRPQRAPIDECLTFAWKSEAIDEAIQHAVVEHRATDPEEVTKIAASHVYPHLPDGREFEHLWPPVPGDCAQLRAIWYRIACRVRRHTAAIEDDQADQVWWDQGGR